jgi:hypothetical protein
VPAILAVKALTVPLALPVGRFEAADGIRCLFPGKGLKLIFAGTIGQKVSVYNMGRTTLTVQINLNLI